MDYQMKLLSSLILTFLMIGLIPLAVFPESSDSKKDEMEKKLAAGELISSSEPVEGTKVRRGRVIGIVDAPPNIVWKVIGDNNNFKNFMPHTLESIVVDKDLMPIILEKKPKNEREVEEIVGLAVDPKIYHVKGGKYSVYFYTLLDFPWPISNKWYILKIDRDETRSTQGIYISSWDMVIGNLRTNKGSWFLEPYSEGRTKVTYNLLTDPGGKIPDFFINMGTEVTMPDVIRAVRKRAKEIVIESLSHYGLCAMGNGPWARY